MHQAVDGMQSDGENQGETGAGGRKLFGDALFSVCERVVSQLAQLAVFILAARLLGPAEFGLFALVSACAILLLKVAEVGWSPFIMSHAGDETVPLQVLSVAIANGIALAFLGALAALGAGRFGVGSDTVLLSVLFAVWVALANASSAQKGILIWMKRLKGAAICDMAGELTGLAVAVATLLGGAGVFALVYGRLASQTATLALSFAMTRHAPRGGITRMLLHDLWAFSSRIFAARMLVHLRLHFVTLIVGGFLGPAAVGVFRAADRLVGAVAELVLVPGQLLAWTELRRARDGGDAAGLGDRLNRQVARHLKMLVVFGAPPLIWLIVMNEELVRGVLGEDWQAAAPLVAILALSRLLLFPGILTEPLLSLVGAARRLPAFMAGIMVVSLVLTFVAVHFGVHAVAWSQVAISVVVLVATVGLFTRHAGIRWGGVVVALRGSILPLVCGIAAIVLLDRGGAGLGLPDLAEAVLFGLGGLAAYALALAICEPGLRAEIAAILRRRPVAT
ncbi:oligosaccharide flippase family protein [Oceaniglobus trochenteri]|uniref:oligosaccharide flippase family protein n=1 Tax=Oceaniglobus trochenteri TaxID=2763260 RepID=UPI001CFFE09C|nr:oligosaccharide flippase family protein [Oceaniglobus trochenteri]